MSDAGRKPFFCLNILNFSAEEFNMARAFDRKLILEDGSVYYGYGFGSRRSSV